MLAGIVTVASLVTLGACNEQDKKIEPAEIRLLVPSPSSNNPNSLLIDKIYTATASSFAKINPLINVIIDHIPASDYNSKEGDSAVGNMDSAETVHTVKWLGIVPRQIKKLDSVINEIIPF
jgi:hypothetical protein